MFVLEMRPHCDLSLETAVTYWAVIRQRFRMRCKMLGKVVFTEKSLLTNSAFIGFDARMAHFVPAHVGPVGKLHVAHITFEHLPVHPAIRRIVILDFNLVFCRHRGLTSRQVCCQRGLVRRFKSITSIASQHTFTRIIIGIRT